MPIIERAVLIQAPVETVFAVEDDPSRSIEYLVGVVAVDDVVQTPARVGDTSRLTFRILGRRMLATMTVLEWEPNARIVTKMEGGLGETFTGLYQPQGSGARVTWRIDYTPSGLGRLLDALVVRRLNAQAMRRGLENLKRLCEREHARAARG